MDPCRQELDCFIIRASILPVVNGAQQFQSSILGHLRGLNVHPIPKSDQEIQAPSIVIPTPVWMVAMCMHDVVWFALNLCRFPKLWR